MFSRSLVSNSLQSYGLQYTRLPCPSLTSRVGSRSHPLRNWGEDKLREKTMLSKKKKLFTQESIYSLFAQVSFIYYFWQCCTTGRIGTIPILQVWKLTMSIAHMQRQHDVGQRCWKGAEKTGWPCSFVHVISLGWLTLGCYIYTRGQIGIFLLKSPWCHLPEWHGIGSLMPGTAGVTCIPPSCGFHMIPGCQGHVTTHAFTSCSYCSLCCIS